MKRVTVEDVHRIKGSDGRLVVVTAYDYPTGRLVDEVGVPVVLVGDTLGMVVLGYETTLQVTVEEMLHHTRAVARGVRRALIVADLPFASYRAGADEAVRVAARFLCEAGAHAVKLEGGRDVAGVIERLVQAGIPVMGHIGLTPQSVHQLGGYRVQGRTAAAVASLVADAEAVAHAGAFSLVLECVPSPVARILTERVPIPTIGIGAGPGCDGQVQVLTDIAGLTFGHLPKHAWVFADAGQTLRAAISGFREAVEAGEFPGEGQSFSIDPGELSPWNS